MTILVMGDLVDDIVVRPLTEVTEASDTNAEIRMHQGGSAANVAAWLGHLGTDVRFLGRAGVTGIDRHRMALGKHGVDARIAADHELDTATIVLNLGAGGERTMFVDRGANARFTVVDIPEDAFDGVEWLHLTGYSLFDERVRPAALQLIETAKQQGIGVSIDPSSLTFLRTCGAENFSTWSSRADILFPNLDEGLFLAGMDDPDEAVAALGARHTAVVLTLGVLGAIHHDGQTETRGPARSARVVDTTGAGDAYCAGYLSALRSGADVAACMLSGARAAAQAVAHMGARPTSNG